MKALIITSSFPRDANDIAGRFVLEHAQALQRGGIHCQVLTWADKDSGLDTIDGVRVKRVNYAPRRHRSLFYGSGAPENLSAAPARALLAPPALVAMMARAAYDIGEFDVILGHWLVPGGWIARQLGRIFNRPSLIIGHSGGVHLVAKLPRLARLAIVPMLRGPTTISSAPLQTKVAELGLTAEVLPMGFVAPHAHATGRAWMSMGRLEPIKGLDRFLAAFAEAGVSIQIAGDGSSRAELERLCADLAIDADFVGIVSGARKDALLSRSRFAAFPSQRLKNRHEGLPVSLLECASAGVIPVVGDIPGSDILLADPDLQTLKEPWLDALTRLATLSLEQLEDLSERQRQRVSHLEWQVLGPKWCERVLSLPAN